MYEIYMENIIEECYSSECTKKFTAFLFSFSELVKKMKATPNKNSKNKSDGGYFLGFKNEIKSLDAVS
jgi:hypothetical protein